MRFALFFAAALLAAPALAQDMVASNGSDTVRLSASPCSSDAVLSRIRASFRPVLKDAVATVQGQSHKACWLINGGDAHLLYEDGDQGLIPLTDFKTPKSA